MSTTVILFHLKLVSKVSLAIGVVAVLVLVAVLTLITGEGGHSYGTIIASHSLSRRHLGAAMVAAGLLLVAFTCILTCLIIYYSSLRVAGPLYRFGQNLRLASSSDSSTLIELRSGDALVRHAEGVKHAVGAVRGHYLQLGMAARAAATAAAAGDSAGYAAALAQLKQLDAQVAL